MGRWGGKRKREGRERGIKRQGEGEMRRGRGERGRGERVKKREGGVQEVMRKVLGFLLLYLFF